MREIIKIHEIIKFGKLESFQNFTIWKTKKIPKISNLINHISWVFE